MISRLLKGFAEQGWVRLGREQIEILDPAALRQLAVARPGSPRATAAGCRYLTWRTWRNPSLPGGWLSPPPAR
jgi:hypothetical protein